jgi:hypothetical protein
MMSAGDADALRAKSFKIAREFEPVNVKSLTADGEGKGDGCRRIGPLIQTAGWVFPREVGTPAEYGGNTAVETERGMDRALRAYLDSRCPHGSQRKHCSTCQRAHRLGTNKRAKLPADPSHRSVYERHYG